MDKKGQTSPGFAWILLLVLLFGTGLIFIIFNQVMTNELYPVAVDFINSSEHTNQTQKDEGIISVSQYMTFFGDVPIIIFFILIFFAIATSIRKEPGGGGY